MSALSSASRTRAPDVSISASFARSVSGTTSSGTQLSVSATYGATAVAVETRLRAAPAGAYRRWIAIGLGLSLLGDLLLEWPADLFVFGLSAFLLAHLAYLAAYLGDTRRLAPFDLLIAATAAGGMFFVLSRAGLGTLLAPVALMILDLTTSGEVSLRRILLQPVRNPLIIGSLLGLIVALRCAPLMNVPFTEPGLRLDTLSKNA